MSNLKIFDITIEPSQQGSYFTVPFQVPPGIESLSLKYHYPRRDNARETFENGSFNAQPEICIIDLGLIDPHGEQVGASGSDKSEIFISEALATPGYRPTRIEPGEWQVLVGAYKVPPAGTRVHYEITFTQKYTRLLKGDLHTHTLASDGVHSLEELAIKALRSGLDFLAVTDHNQMISYDALPHQPGLTIIPGIEWTHYQGHANFLGVERPYDGSFACNSLAEALPRFQSARERGALITINHPFEPDCGFLFDMHTLPFDCLEVWNGPMREPNLKSLGMWQQMLISGRKIPVIGGSDYHRDTPFIFLGGPTTCTYAGSGGVSDILQALRSGHTFITFAPNGPTLEMAAGEAIMGDSLAWAEGLQVNIKACGLKAGDVVQVITRQGAETIFKAPADGEMEYQYPVRVAGFVRVEILRTFLPGIPMLPAALSNPIYFDAR
ncbi:MAG TPA: CehA/McbA family metallohydrolase [Anaerolineaceae bacterium]